MMVDRCGGGSRGGGFERVLIDSPFDRTTFEGAMNMRLGQTYTCLNIISGWFDVTVTALNAGYSEPMR